VYVDIVRIGGDIYVDGRKKIFAVDFKRSDVLSYENVDWLIRWAKFGLEAAGHIIPHFESKTTAEFELAARSQANIPNESRREESMDSKSLEATEAECAAGRTAPRVTLDDIKAAIASEYYATGDKLMPQDGPVSERDTNALSILTICLIVMTNGFTIIGKAAPASPANFDAELGKKLAYEDAVRQIWPLMGFSLRDKLAAKDGDRGL
jgi:hypothetical protein